MKKIISFLFFLQLIAIGVIVSMSVNVHFFDQLLFAGTTDMEIVFHDDKVGFNILMEALEEHDLIGMKLRFMDYETLHLYLTDVTFENQINLIEGRLPERESLEFISNTIHDDVYQVGLVGNMTPAFDITIRHLENVDTLNVNGRYRLNTMDRSVLADIESRLSDAVSFLQVYEPMEDDRNLATTVMMGVMVMPTYTMAILVVAIPLITLFCLGTTLLQFSMSKTKASFTLYVHGFSQRKIVANAIYELMIPLAITALFAYFVLYGYLFVTDLTRFQWQFNFVFLVLCLFLLVLYALIILITMTLTFQLLPTVSAIKGYKPDAIIQLLNHSLKAIFMSLFLISTYATINHTIDLINQRSHLSGWENHQDVWIGYNKLDRKNKFL